ncbi:hypothetical protein [Paenibacillus sp. S29]|uniref:hypothetical protein n=1 Tax=Paenibacillus sp. S29 TaxID=3394611 RepID=UPI0039BF1D2A
MENDKQLEIVQALYKMSSILLLFNNRIKELEKKAMIDSSEWYAIERSISNLDITLVKMEKELLAEATDQSS